VGRVGLKLRRGGTRYNDCVGNPPAPKLVLVVEDDPSVCDLVAKALRAKGLEVAQAFDGMAASQMLGSLERLPDLVICDVMMPAVDGFSLARLMKSRAELRGIPIIFLSARTEAKDLIEGISVGARHYVQKPFKLKDLMDKVEKCLR
jgi:two-component system, OmpR family, phosphate regulon response regulator PhoB